MRIWRVFVAAFLEARQRWREQRARRAEIKTGTGGNVQAQIEDRYREVHRELGERRHRW